MASGRHAEALARLRHAVDVEPERFDLLLECARIEWALGNAVRAAADCEAALDRAPSDVAAWILLGEIARANDPVRAESALRRALALAPGNAEAHFHLGNLYRDRDDLVAARREFECALESEPDHVGLLNNLGLVLVACGERERAEACYQRVLAANPQHPDALGNLASSLFEREAFRQSVAAYRRLFSIRRDVPAAVWVRRGVAHQRVHDLAAAETCFAEAARLLPDAVQIQLNLGTVRSELRCHVEAEHAWLRALELRPDSPHALSMLAHGRQHRCDWRGLSELHDRLNRLLESADEAPDDRINPFTVLAMPSTPMAQLRAAQRWARGIVPRAPVARPSVALAPGQRLRVGFVSSDFRAHPMAYLSVEFWERIDGDRFETFAYGIRERDRGPIGERIARAFEHYADVSDMSIDATVQRIRADRIAILIDLNGYTRHSRERIFALRPAPVQINYIGYPGTLGAPWYDYILVDHFSAPDASRPFFSERLLQLPHSSIPSDTGRAPGGAPPGRAECGLPPDAFVFCCFNSTYKILPDVFAVWMRLLDAVPGSVLWLLAGDQESMENLRREAANSGIDPVRLVFAPRISHVERHIARTAVADLFLDTHPYGAHTTANDALLAGVPVVTHAGDVLASRIAGSQLLAVGLPELVTSSAASYAALGLRLAQNPVELAGLRVRLAANRSTHPLFDMARFTRDVEEALWRAWREVADAA